MSQLAAAADRVLAGRALARALGVTAALLFLRDPVTAGFVPAPGFFPVSALDLQAARIAAPSKEPELRPMVKLFGTRMPGLSSGWFLTRGRKRAYVLSSTGDRYAVLPLRDGRLLLLGVAQPEALLAGLRDEAGRRR